MSDAAEKQRLARDSELDDIKDIMARRRGRRFMWRLIGHCQVFQEPGPASADIHNYKAGMRGVGLLVYNDIKIAAPEDFRRMEFENTTLAAAVEEAEERAAQASLPEDIYHAERD